MDIFWIENKNEQGEIMLSQTFVLKVINKERKKFIDHEIIGRIAEQNKLGITQVCKGLKMWIQPNLRWPIFSFTYSFTSTYFCIIYIYNIYANLNKRILFKKIRNHSKPLKLQSNKNLSQNCIKGRLQCTC